MAACLLYRKAGLQEFTPEVVNRPEVKAMIERVHFVVNQEAEAAGYNKMTTILAIKLKIVAKLEDVSDLKTLTSLLTV